MLVVSTKAEAVSKSCKIGSAVLVAGKPVSDAVIVIESPIAVGKYETVTVADVAV
jgi:hypothetical protein